MADECASAGSSGKTPRGPNVEMYAVIKSIGGGDWFFDTQPADYTTTRTAFDREVRVFDRLGITKTRMKLVRLGQDMSENEEGEQAWAS